MKCKNAVSTTKAICKPLLFVVALLFPHVSKVKHLAAGNKQTDSASLNSKWFNLAASYIKGQMLMSSILLPL